MLPNSRQGEFSWALVQDQPLTMQGALAGRGGRRRRSSPPVSGAKGSATQGEPEQTTAKLAALPPFTSLSALHPRPPKS